MSGKEIMKKTISIVISVMMLLTVSPFLTDVINGNGYANAITGVGTANAIVEQAKSYKGITSLPSVKHEMERRGYSLWNKGYTGEWCAWFVSNCARQAGVPTSVIENNICADRSFYRQKGVYYNGEAYGGNYTPVEGDLIFFDWYESDEGGRNGLSDHIGIVRYSENGIVYTIEGNSRNSVRRKSYSMDIFDILGYAHPNYVKCKTHTWNEKTGTCNKCGYPYTEMDGIKNEPKNGNADQTKFFDQQYRIKPNVTDAYIRKYPSTGADKVWKTAVSKGRYIYVYGSLTKNGTKWYKVKGETSNSIGYIEASKIEDYEADTSSSTVAVTGLKDIKLTYKSSTVPPTGAKASSKLIIVSIFGELDGEKHSVLNTDFDRDIYIADTNLMGKFNWKGLSAGTHKFKLYAYDVSGKKSEIAEKTVYVDYDVKTPKIQATPVMGGYKVTFTNRTENAAGDLYVKLTEKGRYTKKASGYYQTITTEGIRDISAYTKLGGNKSAAAKAHIDLEQLDAPTFEIDQTGKTAEVTIKVKSGSVIDYTIGDVKEEGVKSPVTVEVSGGETLKAYANRKGYVRSEPATYECELTEPDAPEVKLSNADSVIGTGKIATVTWKEDRKATAYTARLYDAKGQVKETQEGLKNTASFTLEEAGEYYITVYGSNELGDSEESERIEITAVDPLTVTFRNAPTIDEETGEETVGEVLETRIVDYGEKLSEVEDPSRSGYSFEGWKNADTGKISTNDYLLNAVTEDLEYIASYRGKTYTVRFYGPNDTNNVIDKAEVAYGQAVDTSAAEKKLELPEGTSLTGWNVLRTSDPGSRADITAVDSDMEVQAIVTWENPELPVAITFGDSVLEPEEMGMVYRPNIKLNTSSAKDLDIYLVASLKGTDSESGVEKTLYTDRRQFTLKAGEEIELNPAGSSSHDFDLKLDTSEEANAVRKLEVVALERREDGTTGSTYSVLAAKDVTRTVGYEKPSEWSTEEPEAIEGRYIETSSQYTYQDQEYAYSGYDTLDGYEKVAGGTETTVTYGNWASSKPIVPDSETNDSYRTVYTVSDSDCNDAAHKWFAYICPCGKTHAKNGYTVCSSCGEKTTQTLVVYSTTSVDGESTGMYSFKKTLTASATGNCRIIYLGGKRVDSFTARTEAGKTQLWKAGEFEKTIYRLKTTKSRNKFWKWGEEQTSTTEPASSGTRRITSVETLYRYSDIITELPEETELEGEVVTLQGNLNTGIDLNGKLATIMVYQTNNRDPNKYQMQYTGQVMFGEDNSYEFSFIPKKDPDESTGNYIVSLGVEGTTGLVTVGVIEAPKETYKVTLYYKDENEQIVQIGEPQIVKDGEDVDLSVIEIPEREGYIFTGWDRRTTNITSSGYIKATYAAIPNAVAIVDWVRSDIDLFTAETGTVITLPGEPEELNGYTFTGWRTPEGDLKGAGEEYTIKGRTVIEAEYAHQEYTVRFLGAGNEVVDTQTVKYGEAAEPPEYEWSGENGEFAGWSTEHNWWKVDGDMDVLPIVIYDKDAEKPSANIITIEAVGDGGDDTKAVELSFEEDEAEDSIYYTDDGTIPTASLISEYIHSDKAEYEGSIKEYTEPIVLNEYIDLLAVGYSEGKNESELCYLNYMNAADAEDTSNFNSLTVEWIKIGTYNVKAKEGKDITVTVRLDENPGLVGYEFLIECDRSFSVDRDEYDDPVCELGAVSSEGILTTGDAHDGYRVMWNSEDASTENGELFTMKLHAEEEMEEGIYPITVSYAKDNTINKEYDRVDLESVNVEVLSEASIDMATKEVVIPRNSYEYESRAIEPAVSIEGLKEGEDFSVVYENNIDVGTAKAIVTGMGDYAGTVEKEFTITQANIANADMEAIPDQVMTGSAIEPELILSYNGTALERDKDYEVSYDKNVSIGTAEVTISGKGNFRGSKAATFVITETLESQIALLEKELEESEQARQDAEARIAELTAAKEAAEQNAADLQAQYDEAAAEVGRLSDEKAALEADAEANAEKLAEIEKQLSEAEAARKAAEEDLAAANEEKARLEGDLKEANAAKEAAEKRAEEAEKALEEAQQGGTPDKKISLNSAAVAGIEDMTYTGQELTQDITVTLDGRELIAGTDYAVTYSSNVDVGMATLTVSGNGKYEGSVSETFRILPKGTTVSKLVKAKKGFTVKWKKQSAKISASRITGYQIQYSTKKDFSSGNKTATVKGYKKTSKKVSKLKAKKKYYVRIRTYKTVDGTKYYSDWSKAKYVKTK